MPYQLPEPAPSLLLGWLQRGKNLLTTIWQSASPAITEALTPPEIDKQPERLYAVAAALFMLHGFWAGFVGLHILLLIACTAMAIFLHSKHTWAHYASISLCGVAVIAVPLGNAAFRIYGGKAVPGEWVYTLAIFALAAAAMCSVLCLWFRR
jgi:hypothetical protein